MNIDPSELTTGILGSAIVAVAAAGLKVLRTFLDSSDKGGDGDPVDTGPDDNPPPPAIAA